MRPVVVRLDVVKVARRGERGDVPVQLAQPEVDRRISVADGPEVALEVAIVCDVKANLRREALSIERSSLSEEHDERW